MEELVVFEGSPLISKTLEESEIRHRYGIIIVAVKKESGQMIFNPLANYIISNGDKLIALGENENVSLFAKVCASTG
jgi:voltage-gated potassium channel